jgi:hypothetical protein
MARVTDYTARITSEHATAPKFMAMVGSVAQGFVDLQNFLATVPFTFDLDVAAGVQLDAVGRWVGITRNIAVPISGVYFSFDIAGIGFDQGNWKGPFDITSGIVSLDDDTYRLLLKAKIGANHWDGTLNGSAEILTGIFSTVTTSELYGAGLYGAGLYGAPVVLTYVFIQDNQDMSITIGVSGQIPSALFLALLSGGYIPIKPEGVQVNGYLVTSVPNTSLFGFDVNNSYVSGFDAGAWGTAL